MIQSLRGMNDLFDEESARFSHFIQTATRIAKQYTFEFINTPILEETKLFKRSVGQSSDIVGKEMYQFTDKGDNDVCMRPEGTAGVVRAFIQKKLDRAGGKHRYFYYGPMFRYERPQKGRLRQFHQFGVESFGSASVYEDISMILMLRDIFDALNIGYTIELNSLGCQSCMPNYRQMLVDFLDDHHEQICEDCIRRKALNPIRVLDCKNQTCQDVYTKAPKLIDNLCPTCNSEFATLTQQLDTMHIPYTINTHLVRGLDYYSKTAFEFTSTDIGAQSAIAGGGRYDKLVEFLDGKETAAVGFAIGIERIMPLITLPEVSSNLWYFGATAHDVIPQLFTIASQKRLECAVMIEYEKRSFTKHLTLAQKNNAHYCVLIDDDNIKHETVWIKNMRTNEEKTIPTHALFQKAK